MENSFSTDHKPLPHMERWYLCDHQALAGSFSVISTASNRGYKIPVPTAVKQSVDWLHLDSFPAMENCLPQTPSTHGMERWYFCDHQTTFQSFPLHLTMATNFLCPLQWNRVSTDSICIVFHPWKTLPQTHFTHGKVVFLWPPDSF